MVREIKCGACKDLLMEEEPRIKCGQCNTIFHYSKQCAPRNINGKDLCEKCINKGR